MRKAFFVLMFVLVSMGVFAEGITVNTSAEDIWLLIFTEGDGGGTGIVYSSL
jgi:hypothetical protein